MIDKPLDFNLLDQLILGSPDSEEGRGYVLVVEYRV